jgi:hypothetical protein
VEVPQPPAVDAPVPEAKPKPEPKKPRMVKLSDERLVTKWAHSETRGTVFRRHSLHSPRAGKLRLYTEDGFPEVYIALREYTDSKHRKWVQVRIPKRPNGKIGWVLRRALGPYRTSRQQLAVNRTTLRATLYHRGRSIWSARIGVGTSATRTPAGRFYVREKFRFKNAPVYGTRAIGTSAYAPTLSDWPGGGVIGIHGTNQPGLIPGRPSHGCVRVRNEDIARLYRRIQIGTPIHIR